MAATDAVDARLTTACSRRPYLTRGDFWRLINTLLDDRNAITAKPDTGDDVPTREALNGSARTTAGPERPAP